MPYQQVRWLRQNNIHPDYILKIHTKESNAPIPDLYNWRSQLINPLVNVRKMQVMKSLFDKGKITGYVGSQICCVPSSFDSHNTGLKIQMQNICDKHNLPKTYQDFIDGTMFWMNYDVIENYLTEDFMSDVEQIFRW